MDNVEQGTEHTALRTPVLMASGDCVVANPNRLKTADEEIEDLVGYGRSETLFPENLYVWYVVIQEMQHSVSVHTFSPKLLHNNFI